MPDCSSSHCVLVLFSRQTTCSTENQRKEYYTIILSVFQSVTVRLAPLPRMGQRTKAEGGARFDLFHLTKREIFTSCKLFSTNTRHRNTFLDSCVGFTDVTIVQGIVGVGDLTAKEQYD